MKQLLILRHAKSSWDNPALADIERPLAKRGIKNAIAMGRRLRAEGMETDRVLCSDAQRTHETWTLLAPEWLADREVPFNYSRELYLTSHDRLLQLCKQTEEDVRRLMLIGHNPGLHELCLKLCGTARDPQTLTKLKGKLPTGAFVLISFPVDAWRDLGKGIGCLELFLRPRDLD